MIKCCLKFLCCALFYSSITNAEGSYVSANGMNIYYEEYGEGSPLVLLHGGSLTSQSWKWLIPEASQHFHVYAMDSRGHGRTDNPDGEVSYEQMADDVATFIRKLKINKPVVMGYSDGGLTTLLLAMQYPEIPAAIIIGGATDTLGNSEKYFDGMQQFFVVDSKGTISEEELDTIASKREGMIDFWRKFHQQEGNPEYWRTLVQNVWRMWTSPVEFDDGDFKKITMPALVLLGDRDEFFSVEDAASLYSKLPNAEMAIAPGADHSFFREKADLFNSLVLDFLLRLKPEIEEVK